MSENLEEWIVKQSISDVGRNDHLLPIDVQQACLTWIEDIKHSSTEFYKNETYQDNVLLFLINHFNYWIDALVSMRQVPEGIAMLRTLENIVNVSHSQYSPPVHAEMKSVQII